MNIGTYSYEEYVQLVISFHGAAAPGLLIGGFIVDMALNNLPEGEFFDAICETPVCLPDSVQLLTPCTIGNGWLTIFNFGKFAVTLYDKKSGDGIRVYLDMEKLKNWSEVNSWFLKLKTKKEQDHDLLMSQIKEAGYSMLSMQKVRVVPDQVTRKKMGPTAICPVCHEAYPVNHGDKCRNCNGESPYI
ncbi:MAG TPA: formylmethanofuran dehydrogenase subunit E family protein [Spirochaetota bacterium]|nr:formylmethanofuran dehydrogenase subunit E family protein [Spirochaetota bacterium]HPS87875.1 formylmethanofuran dehydrogenase subunit E family protein [Spirochaetota bacterium]